MGEPAEQQERLTEFERAVCYDTLPRVTSSLTLSMIALYAILTVLAAFAMVYGIATDQPFLKTFGMGAFAVVVCVGLAGFMFRALYNAVRERAMLLDAQSMPNVESNFDDLPDPFEHHALLRYFRHEDKGIKVLQSNRGETVYTAERVQSGGAWEVRDPANEVTMRIEPRKASRSFGFDMGTPARFVVLRGDEELGVVRRKFSLGAGHVDIVGSRPQAKPLVFRAGGIYAGEQLVGRVYSIRNSLYLDVKQVCLDHTLLAFYIAMLN